MSHKKSIKNKKITKYINLINETANMLSRYGYSSDIFRNKSSELLEKLNNRQLVVSVIGQFKRGKSSLINALLGDEILPISVLPLTSVAVYIMYANKLSLEITTVKGKYIYKKHTEIKDKLFEFATEKGNPKNKKEVTKISLYYPAEFLKQNIVLVDTPGIGSIYSHNTQVAEDVIPRSDIGIFVVSPDPPFTEIEINYFKSVLPRINTCFFVINKSDIVSKNDLKEVRDFYEKIIRTIVEDQNKKFVFCVSARREIDSKTGWKDSGINVLKKTMLSYLERKRTDILLDISSARIKNLFNIAKNEISLILNTLKMDLRKFEGNILLFNEKLDEIETKSDMINGQLTMHKNKVSVDLDGELDIIKDEVNSSFYGLFMAGVKSGEIFEDEIYKVIDRIASYFERKYKVLEGKIENNALSILNSLKNDFEEPLRQIKKTTAEFFKINIAIPEEAVKFEFSRSPYWVDKNTSFSYKLLKDDLLLKILPRVLRQYILSGKVKQDFDSIVVRNIGNIRWALTQNVQNTFIKYESFYNDKYQDVKKSIFEAIDKVKDAKTDFKQSRGKKIKTLTLILNKLSSRIKRIG